MKDVGAQAETPDQYKCLTNRVKFWHLQLNYYCQSNVLFLIGCLSLM